MMNIRAFPMRAPLNRGTPLHTSQPPPQHWDGLHGRAPESCDRKVCRAHTAGRRLINDPHPPRSASRGWFNDTIIEGGEGGEGHEHKENHVTITNWTTWCLTISQVVLWMLWLMQNQEDLLVAKSAQLIWNSAAKHLWGLRDCVWRENETVETMRNLRIWARSFQVGEAPQSFHWNQEDRNSIVATVQQLQTGNCRTCEISSALLCWGKPLLIQEKIAVGWVRVHVHKHLYTLWMYLYIFHAGT